MPRARLIQTNEFPYHITNRSNNKDFFYIPLELLWDIFIDKLIYIHNELNCKIHCFVLMSNHYHLIISTPDSNLAEAMRYLHREVARDANNVANRMNHFFGGRYKWSLICSENYYWNAIKYIFRNPVDAGICDSVFNYKYSSLNTKLESLKWKNRLLFDGEQYVELSPNWLEQDYKPEQKESIKWALKRKQFKLPQLKSGYCARLDEVQGDMGTITFLSQST